jgi:dipeptidase D
MSEITILSPQSVWHYFSEICQVPRPSGKEDKIIAYLKTFADNNHLEWKQDKTGNVLIKKPGTKGYEKRPPIVLQSHLDMVCEKNSTIQHDFHIDPIKPYIDGDWVKAKGTTLGADDGIGMATQLALLTAKDIDHGPLECLFTIDEETGMTGAFGLEEAFFEGNTLINLDSEDEGELFIGCAGGIDTTGTFQAIFEPVPPISFAFKVSVTGLKGGHSGDDIHRGLGNANKILTRYLWEAARQLDLRISSIDGGNLRNAIAREANAVCITPYAKKEEVRVLLNCFISDLEEEFRNTEPGLKLHLESTAVPELIFSLDLQSKLLNTLYAMPHGVLWMHREITGLVETSTNLASVKQEGDKITVTTSQRSSLESGKTDAANMVESLFLLGGAMVEHSDGYPGWTPNTSSPILKLSVASYEKLFGSSPEVKAIHAGLECGLFLQKYPGLDMISIGPTIKGAHSPDERLNIKSVTRFWDHLTEILKSS